jgi:hypothetical protein
VKRDAQQLGGPACRGPAYPPASLWSGWTSSGGRQQVTRGEADGPTDCVKFQHRQVADAALQAGHVRPIHAGFGGKPLL